jgi:hypothetical protein
MKERAKMPGDQASLEVFHSRPGEVEEMIQMRLEESGSAEERERKGRGRRLFVWGLYMQRSF